MSTPALKQDSAVALPQAAGEASAIVSMIERAARDPSVDIEKLERLMALKERMQQQEAERLFNAAMSRAQAEMPRVLRDATNTHNQSRYARLETIAKAITPTITKHGFSLSFDTQDGAPAGHYRLACTVAHEAGFSRVHRADLPSDAAGSQGKANKTAIQAFGSTMSYGRRYLTLLVFNVALTNEDNDGQPQPRSEPEFITDAQVCELQALLRATDTDLSRFLAYGQVDGLEEIHAEHFESAKNMLLRKVQKSRESTDA